MHRRKVALAGVAVVLQLIGATSYREALAGGRQPTQKTGTIQVTRRPAQKRTHRTRFPPLQIHAPRGVKKLQGTTNLLIH